MTIEDDRDPGYGASSVLLIDGDEADFDTLPSDSVENARVAIESYRQFSDALRVAEQTRPGKQEEVLDSFMAGWVSRG